MRRYRYKKSKNYIQNYNSPFPVFLLIIIICAIVFGFKYKTQIKLFIENTMVEITGKEYDSFSMEKAENFYFAHRDVFEKAATINDKKILLIDNIYISIIDRYDFGGHIIRAFRFQTTGDIGTEIVYSKDELRESSILKEIEKHWYVYTFVVE